VARQTKAAHTVRKGQAEGVGTLKQAVHRTLAAGRVEALGLLSDTVRIPHLHAGVVVRATIIRVERQ
jgi:hypothetical protein